MLKLSSTIEEATDLLETFKADLGITHELDDTRLLDLIERANTIYEKETDRTGVTTQWRQDFSCFRAMHKLTKGPVIEGDEETPTVLIEYYDTDNELQELGADKFYVVNSTDGVCKVLLYEIEPTYARADAVRMTYSTGRVDAEYKMILSWLIAHLNEAREPEVSGTITSELKFGLERAFKRARARRYV